MRNRRFCVSARMLAVSMSAVCFVFFFGVAAAPPVLAADLAPGAAKWENWPKKETTGAAAAGEAAGEKTEAGISKGTWGWIAAGVAVAAIIAIAASDSGGGGGVVSPPVCPQ